MSLWPAHVFAHAAKQGGLSPEAARSALAAAYAAQRRGLPAVLTLNHLAVQTGVSYRFLRCVVERGTEYKFYRFFAVRKRTGGARIIAVPHPDLQRVQKWICRHILNKRICHPAAYAYVPGQERGPRNCAAMHCGATWILKWDLTEFFHSIGERNVYRVFRECGYLPLVALEMARICTSADRAALLRPSRLYSSIAAYNVESEGFLPQGAPSSPMISNHVARRFDDLLSRIAADNTLVYTRYADDITLSTSSGDLTPGRISGLNASVVYAAQACGFKVNEKKFRVCRPGSRKVVLGLLVDQAVPRLTKRYRSRLSRHLHFLLRRGPRSHAKAIRFRSVVALRDHIKGLIEYARTIDEKFGDEMLTQFAAVDWHGVKSPA